jgi:hypothetical protein
MPPPIQCFCNSQRDVRLDIPLRRRVRPPISRCMGDAEGPQGLPAHRSLHGRIDHVRCSLGMLDAEDEAGGPGMCILAPLCEDGRCEHGEAWEDQVGGG